MLRTPLVDREAGLYRVMTAANTDYPVLIPAKATSVVLWFEASATDPTMIRGRVGFDKDGTPIPNLTGTDTLLGYQPPVPVDYGLGQYVAFGLNKHSVTHLHLASNVAGAVVRGMWLYSS